MFLIFTRPDCIWCEKAKNLLKEHGLDFKEVPHLTQEERDKFKAKGFKTFPQIYKGDHLIGGYDALTAYLEEEDDF